MATFAPQEPITLTRRSAASYELASAPDALMAHLERVGYIRQPGRNPHERARLRTRGGRLVVIYRSGTVLVQGVYTEATHSILRQFVSEQGALV